MHRNLKEFAFFYITSFWIEGCANNNELQCTLQRTRDIYDSGWFLIFISYVSGDFFFYLDYISYLRVTRIL